MTPTPTIRRGPKAARSFLVLAFFAAACGLASLAWAPTASAGVFNPEIFTLKNGMQVVVIENHRG